MVLCGAFQLPSLRSGPGLFFSCRTCSSSVFLVIVVNSNNFCLPHSLQCSAFKSYITPHEAEELNKISTFCLKMIRESSLKRHKFGLLFCGDYPASFLDFHGSY